MTNNFTLFSLVILKIQTLCKGLIGQCYIKKQTLAQVFCCEFRKISKNTLSYRTPPVAASTVTRRYKNQKTAFGKDLDLFIRHNKKFKNQKEEKNADT